MIHGLKILRIFPIDKEKNVINYAESRHSLDKWYAESSPFRNNKNKNKNIYFPSSTVHCDNGFYIYDNYDTYE
jgi:hypothetical protein